MSQFQVEYRECGKGKVLHSDLITANDIEEANAVAKRNFTALQVNLGARHYQVLDQHAVVVASH